MKLTVISVGKKHDRTLESAISDFEKRLKSPFSFEWRFLPNSNFEGEKARAEESIRLEKLLARDDFVILLDERGKQFDSPALARQIEQVFPTSKTPVCIIGGAYGVDDSLASRANLTWSLSPLVFPHQLVRLILAEQLYRAQEIAAGHPYHHK